MAVTRLMVSAAPPQAANLRTFEFGGLSSVKLSFTRFSSPNKASTVVNMAPKKKVNKFDQNWEKQWYGAGIFVEGSEDVEVDVFKKLEEKKVLSNVEKSGLLSKAEGLGFTLSSIEKFGFLSKAEELGLLSLVEKAASLSPSTLASLSLPLFVTALAVIVVIPDDSTPLVVLQTAFSGVLGIGAAGFLVMSIVLDGLQEAD